MLDRKQIKVVWGSDLLASLEVLHEHLLATGDAHVAAHSGAPVCTMVAARRVEHFVEKPAHFSFFMTTLPI